MTTTPHRIGQQAKAEITLAEPLERWGLDDANKRAAYLIAQLLELGWAPPRDPAADQPALRPEHAADENSPGRQAFRQARAALAARPKEPK